MSGVVKDDSKSKPEAETEGTGTDVAASVGGEPGTGVAMSTDDADTQIRKQTPHLRVISGAQEAEAEAELEAGASEDTDLSQVPTRIEDEQVEALPPLFPPSKSAVADDGDDAEDGEPKIRIGAAIREQREARGLSLEQVSKELRLHVSMLTAIEEMNAAALGPRVYAIGHIRDYARHLGMEPGKTVNRYKAECAILADPVRKEMAPPKAERKGVSAAPVFGLLVAGLAVAGGGYYVLTSGGSGESNQASPRVAAGAPAATAAETAATPQASAPTQTLRIYATKRARVEFRGADGTKFLARYFSPGESYAPRVGAGWTVTTNEGDAFEWRLGDMTLGQLSEDGGPVYAQSVDAALSRDAQPLTVTEENPVVEFAPAADTDPTTAGAASGQPQVPASTPAAGQQAAPPRAESAPTPRPQPAPARAQTQPARPAPQAEPEPAPEVVDPSLLAYPQ